MAHCLKEPRDINKTCSLEELNQSVNVNMSVNIFV